MNPEVSVVIPTYNRCAMLREAVGSVIAQRDVVLELIIIDDGSTDCTWEDLHHGELAQAISRVAQTCRVIVESTCRRGPAAARNRGAMLARADYVAFLDSDDLWAPQKLSRQLAYMRAHQQYPLVQTQESWIRNGRRVNPGLRHLKHGGDIFVPSLRTCLISPSAVMMRTELFHQSGGFDEELQACEDYDLWLRILSHHRAGLLDESLVTRRAGHPDQLSASVPALDRFRIRALLKLLAAHGLGDCKRLAVAQVLAEKCEIYAKGLKRRQRADDCEFYQELGARTRAWIGGAVEPASEYWDIALQSQPLNVEI